MRLARPVYECMPPLYAAIGGLGFAVAYLDPEGPRTVIAFLIALGMETAALTVFLSAGRITGRAAASIPAVCSICHQRSQSSRSHSRLFDHFRVGGVGRVVAHAR